MKFKVKKKETSFFIALAFLLISLSSKVVANLAFENRPNLTSFDTSELLSKGTRVLRREIEIEVEETGLTKQRTYVAILLADDVAIQDYSQLELNHNSHTTDLKIDFARVHYAGEINVLKDDAITQQNLSSENFFYDNERTLFSLPTLRVGSIIELQYTRTSKKVIIPGHFNRRIGFYWVENKAGSAGIRLDPVLETLVKVSYPKAMTLNFRQSKLIPQAHSKFATDSHQVMVWHAKDLEELKPEVSMPEDLNLFPVVYLSSLKDWKDINSWSSSLFTPHISQDAKIREIAKTIENLAETEDEKIKEVFNYMEENIRYVFAHVGRNGYEPHNALDVLLNGYGDCKDQTVLTVSILKALGIEAYPALISASGGELTKGMPRNYFDHMFVYIPANGDRESLWFDTTGSQIDFPGVHGDYDGKPALVVNGTDSELRSVDLNSEVKDQVQVDVSFGSENGLDVDINLDVIYSGVLGQNIANILNYTPDRDVLVRNLLSPLYPKARLESVDHQKVDDKSDTYKLSAKFRSKEAWKGSPSPLNLSVGINQFVGLAADLSKLDEPEKRTNPYQTYKAFDVVMRVTMSNPGEHYAPIVINTGMDYDSKFFKVKQSGGTNNQGDYIVKAKIEFQEAIVSNNDYSSYYKAANNISELPLWIISYQLNKKQAELAKLATNSDATSLDVIIGNAEIYMNNGEFEQALTHADKAIALFPESADAYYLRGVSLGYLQRFDESNIALNKALELGYEL